MEKQHIGAWTANPEPHPQQREVAVSGMTWAGSMRKSYVSPAIIYESTLETKAGSALGALPGIEVDPDLPGKPTSAGRPSGSLDPVLPAKPVAKPSSGGGGHADPPLPPKP